MVNGSKKVIAEIIKLYKKYEEYVLNNIDSNIFIICKKNKLEINLKNNNEIIDTLEMTFTNEEIELYTYIISRLLRVIYNNIHLIYDSKLKRIYHNNYHYIHIYIDDELFAQRIITYHNNQKNILPKGDKYITKDTIKLLTKRVSMTGKFLERGII